MPGFRIQQTALRFVPLSVPVFHMDLYHFLPIIIETETFLYSVVYTYPPPPSEAEAGIERMDVPGEILNDPPWISGWRTYRYKAHQWRCTAATANFQLQWLLGCLGCLGVLAVTLCGCLHSPVCTVRTDVHSGPLPPYASLSASQQFFPCDYGSNRTIFCGLWVQESTRPKVTNSSSTVLGTNPAPWQPPHCAALP